MGKIKSKQTIEVFLIRNQEGKFFRAVGYSGYGPSWVDDISDAKVYLKSGPARSRCTWWARNYPDYGIPDIVRFTIRYEEGEVLNEKDRVNKSIKRIENEKNQQEQRRLQHEIEKKQAELDKLKDEYVIIPKPKKLQ